MEQVENFDDDDESALLIEILHLLKIDEVFWIFFVHHLVVSILESVLVRQ